MIRYDNTDLWPDLRGWRIVRPGIDEDAIEVARDALEWPSLEAYAERTGLPLTVVQEAVAWARAVWTQEDGDEVAAVLTEATGEAWGWDQDAFFVYLPKGAAFVFPMDRDDDSEESGLRLRQWYAGWDRDDRADSGNGTEYGESAGFEYLIDLAQEAIDRVNAEPEEEDET